MAAAAAAQIPPYGTPDGYHGPFESERFLTELSEAQAAMLARGRGDVHLAALRSCPHIRLHEALTKSSLDARSDRGVGDRRNRRR
jgi:hypothetical protein